MLRVLLLGATGAAAAAPEPAAQARLMRDVPEAFS